MKNEPVETKSTPNSKTPSNGKSKSTTNLNGSKSALNVKKEKIEPQTPTSTPIKSTPSKSNKGKKRSADESLKTEETPKKKKKKEEEEEVWRWWEEKKYEDGRKWTSLEHKGPLFEPPYVPLPSSIEFFYNGSPIKLRPESEEVMTFYAKMLDHDYTKKDIFNENFFRDWRTVSKTLSSMREILNHLIKSQIVHVR